MKTLDVLCAGMALMNFPVRPVDVSVFGQDVTPVEAIDLLPGGDAANQAIMLSKLGRRVALFSKRGEDGFGQMLLSALRDFGRDIDLSAIAVTGEAATCACAMLIRPDGQRHFCSHRGALNTLTVEDIPWGLVERARVVSIGGLLGLRGFDGPGTTALLRGAKAAGAVTVADTKTDIWGLGLPGIRETLAYCDYFFPSVDEAAALSGRDTPEEMARVFLDAGAGHVGIKLGGEGCYFEDAAQRFYLPAFPARAVDTTGAGDAFMSGFIHGLLAGLDARGCCRMGAACGAVNVGVVGPNTAIQSAAQVEEFLREVEG